MSFDPTRHFTQHMNGEVRSIEQDGQFYTPNGDPLTPDTAVPIAQVEVVDLFTQAPIAEPIHLEVAKPLVRKPVQKRAARKKRT